MKKLLLLLALAAGTTPLFAQVEAPRLSRSEAIFNTPAPNTLKHRFHFALGSGNLMAIEVTDPRQLQQLNDLDSLFRAVWTTLQPFTDSLRKPLVSRRIDYVMNRVETRIRLLEHPQQGLQFRIRGADTAQVKVEQDTLRIRLFTLDTLRDPKRIRLYTSEPSYVYEQPYYVTLYLNQVTDVENLSPADLHWALNHLKEELGSNLTKQVPGYSMLYAFYDVTRRRKITPVDPMRFSYRKRSYFNPYVQVGLQFVRGAWAPSTAAGFELTRNVRETRQVHWRLYWEPHFFFNRGEKGALITDRNDFVTFAYTDKEYTTDRKSIRFSTHLTVGYLVRRAGPWLKPGTVKISVPSAIIWKQLHLEPEFWFNDLFKGFSPSLKLTIPFD
ncbi:hypothetical protein [Flaviaesturariibacter amylovorans]|uniref:Bacterial surface antigen (D15) domain-containing protein n=1 Tax=Flaviaesturariibacter amylovorans TaxID=1084520 RepID=A0ABP8HE76_9BACT